MRRRLGILKVTTFMAVALGILLVGELTQAVAESWLASEENAMVADVNQHRRQHGLRSVGVDSALKIVARRQAQRMVMAGKIYHNPDLEREAGRAVPDWMLLGENVGVGPDEPAVQDAFIASPPHHRNIDTRLYNIIGLGAMAADNGAMYFTQNFAQIGKAVIKPVRRVTVRSSPTPRRSPPPIARATVKGIATQRPLAEFTIAPPQPVSPPDQGEQSVSLVAGILAMIGEALSKIGDALSKLAFWR